ncbi:hypothetical protein BRD01_07610 [Halobacteriales archaeon QS_8_65_32]|nr:MAG: hypothetical protein BRD01_07610 [Halobacteriales archaeon QS_8_65_32]
MDDRTDGRGDRADAGNGEPSDSEDDGWTREDVYASVATARSHRDRLERGGEVAVRIRALLLAHARTLPENRPREPRP